MSALWKARWKVGDLAARPREGGAREIVRITNLRTRATRTGKLKLVGFEVVDEVGYAWSPRRYAPLSHLLPLTEVERRARRLETELGA